MSCPRVEWRVNLCFNIALGSPCELTQLAFPALSLLSWHITVVQQLGCSWSSCGELYSQSAEFPFQLSALKCVQNVQLFRHHSGPLAPLWDQDANADKVAEWEKLCFKAETAAKAKIVLYCCLVTALLAGVALCIRILYSKELLNS